MITIVSTCIRLAQRQNNNKYRNTFRGMWYLPHSQVHNDLTVPVIMAECIVHA